MRIQAEGKFLNSFPLSFFLTQGEQNVDVVEFEVERSYAETELSDCTFVLTAVNAEGTEVEAVLTKSVGTDTIVLSWQVTGYFTAVPGLLQLELRAVQSSEAATSDVYDADAVVLKYVLSPVFVREAAAGSEEAPTPETLSQMQNQLAETLATALESIAGEVASQLATLGFSGLVDRIAAAEESIAAFGATASSAITALTQAEYDALETVDATRLYVIIHAEEEET